MGSEESLGRCFLSKPQILTGSWQAVRIVQWEGDTRDHLAWSANRSLTSICMGCPSTPSGPWSITGTRYQLGLALFLNSRKDTLNSSICGRHSPIFFLLTYALHEILGMIPNPVKPPEDERMEIPQLYRRLKVSQTSILSKSLFFKQVFRPTTLQLFIKFLNLILQNSSYVLSNSRTSRPSDSPDSKSHCLPSRTLW